MTEVRFKKKEKIIVSFINKCKETITKMNKLEFECLNFEDNEIETSAKNEAPAYNKVNNLFQGLGKYARNSKRYF